MSSFVYKIGVVGPTRVGKTSLITAILGQSQELLAGSPVALRAEKKTQARINEHLSELRSSLMLHEFNPGAMSGTEEPFVFELSLKLGRSKLQFSMLDYPGAWLDPLSRPESRERQWEECESWINDSPVLLVPIDATVLMEHSLRSEARAALDTLQVATTEQVVRQWTKARNERNEPGLLLFAMLKCESYFNDNGGRRNAAQELFEKTLRFYEPMLRGVEQESDVPGLITVEYHPIDTIGCVEIKRARWDNHSGRLEFSADYLVRPPGEQRAVGADGVLLSLCKHLARHERNKDRTFLRKFWRWVSGEEKQLLKTIQELDSHPFGSRVRDFNR